MGSTHGCCVLCWTNPGDNVLQLYGHLPPITQTIRAKPAGHFWRNKNKGASSVDTLHTSVNQLADIQ